MNKRTLPVLGAIALAAGLLTFAQLSSRAGDDDVKLVIPANTVSNLLTDETKVVNEALKNTKDDKPPPAKALKRAKVAALDIALTAKASKNDAMYAQALKVIDAVKAVEATDKDKTEDVEKALTVARKATSDLSNPPKNGESKGDAIKLVLWDTENKTWDHELAMQLFKTTAGGGLAYEKMIKDFAEKAPTPADMPKIALMATKTAMLSQAIEQISHEKSPAEWKKFAEILRTTALETAEAAAKKNVSAVKTALGRMDTSCVNCHTKFKQQ